MSLDGESVNVMVEIVSKLTNTPVVTLIHDRQRFLGVTVLNRYVGCGKGEDCGVVAIAHRHLGLVHSPCNNHSRTAPNLSGSS